MHWSKIAGVALALVGGLVLTSAHDADGAVTGRCVSVHSEPLGTHLRTPMGTALSKTVSVPINIDGVTTTANVTVTGLPTATPPRLLWTLDFGGGDTWSFGADMTAVNPNYFQFSAADSFVGTGAYANATGSLSFRLTAADIPSELMLASPAPDGPVVLEWGFVGTVCLAPDFQDDACENGKPASLLLRYTGDGPGGTSHSQDAGSVVVTGDANDAATVRIRVTDKRRPFDRKAHVYFDGPVALDGLYTIDAATVDLRALRSTTFVYIFDASDNLLESDEFHTSCSQPLLVGDQYGSTELVGFTTAVKRGK